MYIRRVQRKNIDGSRVSYLQIAENIWDSQHRRSRVCILCTLGRADREAEERLQQLVRSIRKQYGIKITAGVGEAVAPASSEEE